MKQLNYYIVTTKCGHVGKGKYVLIDFPIIAESGKKAAEIARNMPRAKHQWKDAIVHVDKVSREVFQKQNNRNNVDDYLSCKSIQEQRDTCKHISERTYKRNGMKFDEYDQWEKRQSRIQYHMLKQKSQSKTNNLDR